MFEKMLNKLYKYDLLILDDFTFIVAFLSVFYGRTTKGAVDVRSKGLCTYVLRG